MACRFLASLLVVALAVSACRGDAPRGRAGPVVAIAAAGATQGLPAGRAQRVLQREGDALEAPAIAWPLEVGCSLRAEQWKQLALHLRFRAGGPVYAEALEQADDIRITLPVGGAERGATIELAVLGARVRGVIEAGEVRLYPARAFVVGGVLVPSGLMALRWRETRLGALTWAPKHLPQLRFVGEAEGLTGPCDDFAAERGYFETSEAKGLKGLKALRWGRLRCGVSVPVADAFEGPTRATLELGADDADNVAVVAVRGASSRIIWWAERGEEDEGEATVFGWVPSASLRGKGTGEGTVFGGQGGSVGGSLHWIGCDEEAPLLAELDGERRTVGRVLAGTRVRRVAEGDGEGGERGAAGGDGEGSELVAIEIVGPAHHAFPKPVLRPASGARFLMHRADAARCGG